MHVGEHKVECLRWHPTASNILAAAAGPAVKIYDVGRASRIYGRFAVMFWTLQGADGLVGKGTRHNHCD